MQYSVCHLGSIKNMRITYYCFGWLGSTWGNKWLMYLKSCNSMVIIIIGYLTVLLQDVFYKLIGTIKCYCTLHDQIHTGVPEGKLSHWI